MKADPDSTTLYRTYIDGFDNVLDGGVPSGHIILLSGAPGTMKSSLAYYILFRNVTEAGIPGAYITLEQNRDSLLFQMTRLGMKGAPENKLHVVDLATIRKNIKTDEDKDWLEMMKNYILHLRNTYKVELLVIDSLQALDVVCGIDSSRTTMFRWFEWLRSTGMTTYLINEVSGVKAAEPRAEEYLADGIISLSIVKVGRFDFHRRIRCLKMRGMHHMMSYYSLDYTEGQFVAAPPI